MQSHLRGFVAVLAVGCVSFLSAYAGDASAATQTKDQAKCTNAMNKDGQKAAAGAAKDIQTCVKSFAKGGSGLDACVAGVGEKFDKAAGKTLSDYDKKCPDALDKGGEPIRPPYGVSDPATINAAALAKEQAIIGDIFGSDLLSNTVQKEADAKDASKCQQTIVKDVYKCQDTVMKEFNGCKKAGLKDGTINSALDIADCICQSPKNKIAKACVEKISGDIGKKCEGKGVDLSGAFPGCNTDDAGELQICLEDIVNSRVCESIRSMDDLIGTSCLNCPRSIGEVTCTYDTDHFCAGGSNDGLPCVDPEFDSDCPGGKCIGVSTAEVWLASCAPPYGTGGAPCTNHGLFDISQVGEVRMEIGVPNPATGVAPVNCRLNWSDPIEIAGIGTACIYDPTTYDPPKYPPSFPNCVGGMIDCDGGTPLDFRGEHDHVVGVSCGLGDDPNDPDPANHTGPSECEAACVAHCAGKGLALHNPGCEGYCRGGVLEGKYCEFDIECLYEPDGEGTGVDWENSGECVGGEFQAHPNKCNCQCVSAFGTTGGPSRAGGITCHLPIHNTVEFDPPCDKLDVSMFTESCVSHTSEAMNNIVLNANAVTDDFTDVPTEIGSGLKTCSELAAGNATGLWLPGNNWSLDGQIGDMNMPLRIRCQ